MSNQSHVVRRSVAADHRSDHHRTGGGLHPLAAQLIALQRTAGNRAVLTLQRVLGTKSTGIQALPGLVRQSLYALVLMLDRYHASLNVEGYRPDDLLALVQQIQHEALKMLSERAGRSQAAATFLRDLDAECTAEHKTLRAGIAKRPGQVTPGQVLGEGLNGTAYLVDGRPDLVYKEDTGIRVNQLAGTETGINGLSSSRRAVAAARIDKVLSTGVLGDASFAESTMDEHQGHIMGRAPGQVLKDIPQKERLDLFGKLTVKQGLYNLQTLDAVTGEADRNTGNIMLDDSKVTGIDNETAFSPTKTSAQIAGITSLAINYHKGLPEFMSAPVAKKIADEIDVSAVTAVVRDCLGPAEIERVEHNFAALRDHARKLIAEDKIIPSAKGSPDELPVAPDTLAPQDRKDYFYQKG